MSETARLVTAEELERFSSGDFRYELVEGRIVRMSPGGYLHGRVVMRFGSLLEQRVRSRSLGVVLTEVGFKLESDPDTVRAPDIAFICGDRIPSVPPKGFWNGAADLVVGVLSPDDTPAEIQQKVEEYLTRGTAIVLVIDPEDETVSTFRPHDQNTSSADDALDLDDVLPGFRCRAAEIFE